MVSFAYSWNSYAADESNRCVKLSDCGIDSKVSHCPAMALDRFAATFAVSLDVTGSFIVAALGFKLSSSKTGVITGWEIFASICNVCWIICTS